MPITRTKRSPVQSICSGAATGLWLMDREASRIQFSVKQFWGLLPLRGRFDLFDGCIDISGLGSIGGRVAVNASSVTAAHLRAHEQLQSGGLLAAATDPVITFESRYVLLMVPDQAWVTGTLTVAGQRWPVVFETKLKMGQGGGPLVVDARVKSDRFDPGGAWAPRFRCAGAAVLWLHLVFVKE